jgi:ribosomal protein S18 acetylase RimI-like enzyme
MNVRRLSEGETALARSIRLQALADARDAFGSTYEGEQERTPEEWAGWLSSRAVFVAEDASGAAVGLAAGAQRAGEPPGGAYLTSMWVHPACRGTGAADALVRAVISWANSEAISALCLDVVATNHRARQLYARNGFRFTGLEFIRERDGAVELQMQRP